MKSNELRVPVHIWEQVLSVLSDLLKEPVPPYSVLGVEFVVHGGEIRRIKTKREIQVVVQEKEATMT